MADRRSAGMTSRPLLVADLFCGAGGTSTGAQLAIEALGRRMVLTCANHWPIAIETHKRMHPEARHHLQDIAAVRPSVAVPEGYLDLLMASPTCTHHSRARGGKPTSDQQRADPWHIITWLTELRVKRLLIENVPEYVEWGPINLKTGRPIKSRRGEYFRAWIASLKGLGYRVAWRIVNFADLGDATTRQRFILQARNDGRAIVWPQATHSRAGAEDLFGAGARPWRPAREIIDWSVKGRSIYNRPKPLAAKTLQRIYAGATRMRWPEPYIVVLRQHMAAQGIDLPLPSITAGGTHIGLAEPIIVSTRQHTGGPAPRGTGEPVPTLTATDSRIALVEPFVLAQASGGTARPVAEPVPTITAGGNGAAHALIAPYYGSGSGETGRSDAEPLPTITTKARFALAQPILMPQRSDHDPSRTVDDPLPTITTVSRIGMIVPVTHGGGSSRSHGMDAPLPTLTCANRGELAFVTPGFSEREGQAPRTHDLDAPLPTICAQGHMHLAEPALVVMHGRSDVASVDHPAPTITGTSHLAVAEPAPQYDILFRMLQPHELAAAMSFDALGRPYDFAGTKADVIRQIGNAVPVRGARALVAAMLHDLTPAQRTRPDDSVPVEAAAEAA